MDVIILLEILKWLFVVWEVNNHFRHTKKEKALIATVESFDQRLNSLEEKLKLRP